MRMTSAGYLPSLELDDLLPGAVHVEHAWQVLGQALHVLHVLHRLYIVSAWSARGKCILMHGKPSMWYIVGPPCGT